MKSAHQEARERADSHQLPAVVVGGMGYSVAQNTIPSMTVRELARRRRVLFINSEAHGSVLRRIQGRAAHLGARDVARIVLDSTRPRRVEERLWLAPVRGLSAIGPLWAPEPMRRRNVRVIGKVVRGWLDELRAGACVLISYWWSLPELGAEVPHEASIYDCVDDPEALPGSYAPSATVQRLENRLLDSVDRSYVVSPALLAARESAGRKVAVLRSPFDVQLFRHLQSTGLQPPSRLRSLPRPIVGYLGALGQRMDWELLIELTSRRPGWSFVFAGGDPSSAPAALHASANVTFIPAMPYPDGLAVASCFDVGTIPFLIDRFSRGNSFLKLLDYLAYGMPVVSTPLPDTLRVAQAAPGVVEIATDADEWLVQLERALEEPSESPAQAARVAYVEGQSVERRVARMLGDALGA
jgi:glycosyltransferase involved in cell wall biosynthesis